MKRFVIIIMLVLLIGCKKGNAQGVKNNTTVERATEESTLPENKKFDKYINDLHGMKYKDAVNYVENHIVKDTDLLPYYGNIYVSKVNVDKAYLCDLWEVIDPYFGGIDYYSLESYLNKSVLDILKPYSYVQGDSEFHRIDDVKRYSFQGVSKVTDSGLAKNLDRIPTLFVREYNMVYVIPSKEDKSRVTDVEFVFSNRHYDVVNAVVPYNTYGKEYSGYSSQYELSDMITRDTLVEIAKNLIDEYGRGEVLYPSYFDSGRFAELKNQFYETVSSETEIREILQAIDEYRIMQCNASRAFFLEIIWHHPTIGTITLTYQRLWPTRNELLTKYEELYKKDCIRLTISFDDDARHLIGPFEYYYDGNNRDEVVKKLEEDKKGEGGYGIQMGKAWREIESRYENKETNGN
ncbi:MAG: hypothetical protein K6F17_02415 [Lachnospiraceae bacterium]|nr:hypothetical protein [Lachnospiraceae bacterium]